MTKMSRAREGARAIDGECLLSARQVRGKIGNCSEMHIWRLTCHPAYQALKFPKPIKINGRNYWKASAIDRWIASRERVPTEAA